MPSQAFVFGFVANDATPYAITSADNEDHIDMIDLFGDYNQGNTFTIRSYKGRIPMIQTDWEQLDGIGGMTFPITDAEWNTLTPLINNAGGSRIPRIDVFTK